MLRLVLRCFVIFYVAQALLGITLGVYFAVKYGPEAQERIVAFWDIVEKAL